MKDFNIKILGEEWTVSLRAQSEDDYLETRDGYTDISCKTMVIGLQPEDAELKNPTVYLRKVLRHEIIHAFMFESGLAENWSHPAMGQEELTVDWFAIQMHKIYDTCREAEAGMMLLLLEDDKKKLNPTVALFTAYNKQGQPGTDGDDK